GGFCIVTFGPGSLRRGVTCGTTSGGGWVCAIRSDVKYNPTRNTESTIPGRHIAPPYLLSLPSLLDNTPFFAWLQSSIPDVCHHGCPSNLKRRLIVSRLLPGRASQFSGRAPRCP